LWTVDTMLKIFALLIVLLAPVLWAQEDASAAERLARKKWEEEQRLDEYANSLRRRDWLKDRLIFEVGLGTKYAVFGKETFGYGLGLEYITRWHVAPFINYGIVFAKDDPSFDATTAKPVSLAGGARSRYGLTYYFNEKSPLHLGISASYGDVFFDHVAAHDTITMKRDILFVKGWEADMVISYLTNEWYFLNFIAGMYYVGNKLPGTENNSSEENDKNEMVNLMIGGKRIPDLGIVMGVGIGFALPELFPDDTETRRRQRETKREKGK